MLSINDADVGKILTLKTKKYNRSDNYVITYDPDNFSSITIVRILNVQ